MNSAFVVFLLAISLAIYQASAVLTCYITIAGALKFGFFAPYSEGTWREVNNDGTWDDWTLTTEQEGRNFFIRNKGVKEVHPTRMLGGDWYMKNYYRFSGDTKSKCITQMAMRESNTNTVVKPYTYAIVQYEPTFRVKSGKLMSDKGYYQKEELQDFSKLFTGGHYNPTVNATHQQYPGFFWDYSPEWIHFLKPGGTLEVRPMEGESAYRNFYGIFENANEFLLPGAYSERKPLGKVDSGKECIELAKSRATELKGIKRITYNYQSNECTYSNKAVDAVDLTIGKWSWTSAAVNYNPIPTCYINIAGYKKFGFFAPYAPGKWKEVKDDGTWGESSLEVVTNKVILKNYSTYQYPGYYFPYDAPKNCITQSELRVSNGTIAKPFTYAIAQYESPTIRVKKGAKLVSSEGYFTRVKLRDFSKIFTDGHYTPKVNVVNQQYPGFYWDYYYDWLHVLKPGGTLELQPQSGTGKYGRLWLHFYGIFEKANEFLLPGAYSERKLLGKVDSGKACIKLAKRPKYGLTFIKAISYNVETKDCYYSNKEGDTPNNNESKWTSAPVNISLPATPKCFLYVLSLPDNLYDAYAPSGYKEWRSVDNNDKWSDHYIRIKDSKFFIFKKDGTKLIDEPIGHSGGEAWDDGAKCLKKNSQITGRTVDIYSQTEFGVYLSNEPAKGEPYDVRHKSNLTVQKVIDLKFQNSFYTAFEFNENNMVKRHVSYTPGPATNGVLTVRLAPRKTPTNA